MPTHNIYFVDSRVADYQRLVGSLPMDSEWFVLDANRDGIEQMQAILAGYSGLDSIRILSHGSQGALFLGSTVLNNANIDGYSQQLAGIGGSLTSAGDILLYGCNVAQGDVGQSFISALSQYTGADVAASNDLTGSASLGGNWRLEEQTGSIESLNSSMFFDSSAYSYLLADDYAATTVTSGTIAVGGTRAGAIELAGDADWFKVALTAGTTYQFEVLGADTANGTLADPFLDLYNSTGVWLASDDDSGTWFNSLLTYRPTSSGTYYVSASAATISGTGTYLVKASTIPTVVDDYAATTASSGTIAIGGSKAGSIEVGGDEDWFKVTLTAGTTYTINLRGASSGVGTLADPYFKGIYSAAGAYINGTTNDDFGGGRESQITFAPTVSGAYYLSAGGYSTGTGTYQLSISGQVYSDIAATTSTTAAISLGGVIRSEIGTGGDVDWIRANLTGGQTYIIELNADTTSSSPLSDPYFAGIFDNNGVLIPGTANDDYGIGYNSRVTFTPSSSGAFFLAASGYGSTTGAYELRMSSANAGSDVEGQTTATAAALAVGTPKVGAINFARDIDWFKVSLTVGQAYQITARGLDSGSGSLVDPEITGIYNSSGQIILGSGNNNAYGTLDSETIFSPTTSGNYYVAVSAANDGTGSYTVNAAITTATTDLPANATTMAVLQAGVPLSSFIESAGDKDWIKVSLVAGTTYQIDMLGAAAGNGTLADPFIDGVFSSAGQVVPLTSDDDSGTGTNARIVFTAGQSGQYFLSVGAYGAYTGSYQLSLSVTGSDTTAPALLATAPADGAFGVAANSNLSIEFNEAVRAGAGNITIAGGGATRTISITDASQVSFNGTTMTINPSTDLAPSTDYTVTFGSGVVRDLAGNAFGGITSNTQFNFRTAAAGAQDSWTVMVYMAADNNLEPFAIADLNEMEAASLPGSVNVSVLLDRAPGYDTSNGNWTDTRTGLVSHDINTTTVGSSLTSLGELNTGAGATLTNFINSTVASSPANHYALIVWDHGGGLSGTSWDDSNGNDNLTLSEFISAVDASSVSCFDFIGFDACLQGMLEQAWDMRGRSDVLVASQELEPGDGWDYQAWLSALATNPTMSGFDLANAAVNAYGAFYSGTPDTTLSATRIGALPALKTAIDGFAKSAISAGAGITTQLLAAVSRATPINNATENYRDLGDFMREVISVLPSTPVATAAQQVITALENAILSHAGTVAGANGLSIYLPGSAIGASYDMQSISLLQGTSWGNFLRFMLNDQTNDSLIGDAGINDIRGFGGNDYIEGNLGNDFLDGGSGIDTLVGGGGNDTYVVNVATDTVTELASQGADLIQSYVTYSLFDTDGAGANGGNVENLRLMGSAALNATGNGWANVIYANNGVNRVDGGAGIDTVSYLYASTAGATGVTLNLGVLNASGQATASGISGADLIRNVENITGSNYADTLTGNAAANTLNGSAGNDILNGGAGNDVLIGGAGKDRLTGGAGSDSFDFNAIAESLTGANRDVITDFVSGVDKIDLSGIDANTTLAGNQAFTLIASAAAFTGAGQVKCASGILYCNVNGDTVADFQIALTGATTLAQGDYVL